MHSVFYPEEAILEAVSMTCLQTESLSHVVWSDPWIVTSVIFIEEMILVELEAANISRVFADGKGAAGIFVNFEFQLHHLSFATEGI